jgi:DNA invertase Pin-like site-specific DNA recombinase
MNMRNQGLTGLHDMISDLGFDIYYPHKCKSKNPLVVKLRNAIKSSEELLLLERSNINHENITPTMIVVANIDRFGRDIKNMLSLKTQLANKGIHIVSVCQSIKTGTEQGDMSFSREALEAEIFSRDRSYRIKSVKRAKKALGNFIGGRTKFGRITAVVNGVRKQFKHPEESKVIELIHKYNRKGKSRYVIAQSLNQLSMLKRGKRWNTKMVTDVLVDTEKLPNAPPNTPIQLPSVNNITIIDDIPLIPMAEMDISD